MVRRHTFYTIFLVLACASVLQGQYLGAFFPKFVRRLALNDIGQIAHTFLTEGSEVASGMTGGFHKLFKGFHNGVKEDFGLPRENRLIKHITSVLGPADGLESIPVEESDV